MDVLAEFLRGLRDQEEGLPFSPLALDELPDIQEHDQRPDVEVAPAGEPGGVEGPAQQEVEPERDPVQALRANTRRTISRARAGQPQKKGPPLAPRNRTYCNVGRCTGEVQYYGIHRHFEDCHKDIQDIAGAARALRRAQHPRRAPRRPVYRCPECAAEIQDFRRHFANHFARTSAEFLRADANKEVVARPAAL
ncbi:uncharacterized protein LOC122385683 [Amphibalanus amphitrite]|uniref:uncharacterized protein LOC122385683 n=1 Tax=Amphibalanus amphitrite TaxID=1232801 RepID=UPI001C9109BF|nr:uncharacterized protein LOC122385683 [Amphibalanus amphitrite]